MQIDRNNLFLDSNLPQKHFKPIKSSCEKWDNQVKVLVSRIGLGFIVGIVGARGTGKTQLAASLIRENSRILKKSRYEKCFNFFLTMRSCLKPGGMSELEMLDKYIQPPLLVLDEIDIRGNTSWEDNLLTHLIDSRYDSLRDTVLISNQKESEFLKSVGPSIVDRMRESGGIIKCNWKSFRGTKNEKPF